MPFPRPGLLVPSPLSPVTRSLAAAPRGAPRLAAAWLPALLAATLLSTAASPPAAPAPAKLDQRFGVAEGFRNPAAMRDVGAGWERIVLSWPEIQPSGPGDFSQLGLSLPPETVKAELDRGVKLAGLLQFTPDWAAASRDQGQRSPPKNLDLPFDDPNNYFGQYVYQTVKFYAGRIDQWVIWNEPEFKPGDPGAGGSYTWLGTDEQFAQLLKVGYLAAKKANPDAVVSFPGTSYWVDQNASPQRPQFYDHLLDLLARDPGAASHNFYHDAVSLNLYRAPDDIFRVHDTFVQIQARHGLQTPMWLTETNAMPTDDKSITCGHADDAIKTTMEQQAAFGQQAFALAAAAGFTEIEFYKMVDSDPCKEPAVWGLTHDNLSPRPVSEALRTAITYFSGYTRAQFVPLVREPGTWSAWPADAASLVPGWQVYQVAFDRPGNQRVTALWNGDGQALRTRIRKTGAAATLVDRHGSAHALQDAGGWWVADLPAATAHDGGGDPQGYFYIGGDPVLIVQEGTDPATPVAPPELGDPGSGPVGWGLFLSPNGGQTVEAGQSADFALRTVGYGGNRDSITLSVSQWSTQRDGGLDANPRAGSSLPLQVSLTPTVQAGDTAAISIGTAGAGPGIYFIRVQASGGGTTAFSDLQLVVNETSRG